MDYEQALDVLKRMHQAAPKLAKSKLEGVIGLLEQLHHTSDAPAAAPPSNPPSESLRALTRNTGKLSTPTPKAPPVDISRQRTVEVPRIMPIAPPPPPPPDDQDSDSQDSRSFSRLLGRLQSAGVPTNPTTSAKRATGTVDYVFQDFDLDQYSIENMPDRSDSRINFSDLSPSDAQLDDHSQGGVPGTGDLFSDLPEFQTGAGFDPNAFLVDNILGLAREMETSYDSLDGIDESEPVDLFAVLGLNANTGALDEDADAPPPAPRLFDDMTPPLTADGRMFAEDVGIDDVTGLLRGADNLDSDAHGTWRVTDVLRDLGAESDRAALASIASDTGIESSFDLNALYADMRSIEQNWVTTDAARASGDVSDDSIPDPAQFSAAAWGMTAPLPNYDAETDLSPSQFGVTTILPELPESPSQWGANDMLSGAGGNTWGATAMLSDAPDHELPVDDASRRWGATARFGAEPLDDSMAEEMPSARLWGATAPLADGAPPAAWDAVADEMPSARLWGVTAQFADAPPETEWDADEMPSARLWASPLPDTAGSDDAGLNALEEAWMIEDDTNPPNITDIGDPTHARWSEPPTWLVDAPLASDPTRHHQAGADWEPTDGEHGSGLTAFNGNVHMAQRGAGTDRLDEAAWNAAYQPNGADDAQAASLYHLFDGVDNHGGVVPDEYGMYDANVLNGQAALENIVAFAVGESPAQVGGAQASDLPGPAALLTNVREVLKPSLLLLRAQTALIRDRVDETLDERDSEMVRLMQDNAEMALTLLESLELIMQLSEGALNLQNDVFSCIDLLREAGERMQDRARGYKHRITVQLDRGLPPLRADYRRTLAILVDLMDNAVRYTPEGGASRIAVDNLGGYVLFTVADNGIGLNEQEMAYLGQPFWRGLHQPLVRAHRGTGLRLYLARRVLAMQDGELFFSGESGRGSTFSFTVPTEQAMLG